MILRGMHDIGCDEIFIIVTDLKRQEMDDVTEYFKLVCRHAYGRTCKPSIAQRIQAERMWRDPFSSFPPTNLRLSQISDCRIPSSSNGAPHASPRSTSPCAPSCMRSSRASSCCSRIKRPPTPRYSSRITPSSPTRRSSTTTQPAALIPAAPRTAR